MFEICSDTFEICSDKFEIVRLFSDSFERFREVFNKFVVCAFNGSFVSYVLDVGFEMDSCDLDVGLELDSWAFFFPLLELELLSLFCEGLLSTTFLSP